MAWCDANNSIMWQSRAIDNLITNIFQIEMILKTNAEITKKKNQWIQVIISFKIAFYRCTFVCA